MAKFNLLCILFGHIWKPQGTGYVCSRCGAVYNNKGKK